MGMDVYGKNPKSEVGWYFRNNVRWWHPLATYVVDVAPQIASKCVHCHEPEVDEVEAVECEYCRAIYEHTGRIHCPIHTESLPEPESILALASEATTRASETALA